MSEAFQITVFESLAFVVAAAAIFARVFHMQKRSRPAQVAALVILIALSVVPIGGLTTSEYFLTIVGHLSFTSMCLLVFSIGQSLSGKSYWKRSEKPLVLIAALISGILLYLAAFGVLSLDIYQTGYDSIGIVVILAATAAAASVFRFDVALVVLISGAAAFQLQLLRSENIWDYLVDPLLVIYSAISLTKTALNWIRSPRPTGSVAAAESQ